MDPKKVALVTGGTKGIGKAIVESFLEKGFIVFATYAHDDQAADILKNGLEAKSKDNLKIKKVNVADLVSVQELVDFICSKYGKIDILINNAGVEISKLTLQLSEEEWNHVITTNLTGTFYCSKCVASKMLTKKFGRIVNISSIASEKANIGQVAYSASKAGINSITRVLAKEMAKFNITVNSVAPGFIDTEMVANFQEFKKTIPVKRFGTAKEVANLVFFLTSEEASYITGSVYTIDGGLSL